MDKGVKGLDPRSLVPASIARWFASLSFNPRAVRIEPGTMATDCARSTRQRNQIRIVPDKADVPPIQV
jgi:hypothetical protein